MATAVRARVQRAARAGTRSSSSAAAAPMPRRRAGLVAAVLAAGGLAAARRPALAIEGSEGMSDCDPVCGKAKTITKEGNDEYARMMAQINARKAAASADK